MINRVILIGRLTRDPDSRFTESAIAVTDMSLAVERNFKDREGNKQVDFIDLIAWRKTAELCSQYLSKGSLVGIEGTLQQQRWEDKEGKKRSKHVVCVDSVQFLGGKSDSITAGDGENNTEGGPDDGPLPF